MTRAVLSFSWIALFVHGLIGGEILSNPGFERGLDGWRVTGDPKSVSVVHDETGHGTCVRLAPVHALAGIETERLLRDGPDIDLFDTWELSARIKLGRIDRGAFNALLYCYGMDGRFVDMKAFYTARAPQTGGAWRTIRLVFGPAGPWRPPPETAKIKVRFSFWSEDRHCTGSTWVDDVHLRRVGVSAPPGGKLLSAKATGAVGVWRDPKVRRKPACDLDALAELVHEQGLRTVRVTTTELCDAAALARRGFTLLILPYGPAFPATGKTALLRYLRRGGDLIVLGGAAFETPLVDVGGHWGTPADFLTPGPGAKIADFDRGLPGTLLLDHRAADGSRGQVEITGPGAEGSTRALRYRTPDLAAFEYVGLKLAEPAPMDAALVFRAQGGPRTPWLCIEAREDDGSRWKAIVRLMEKWETFVLHAGDFFLYAAQDLPRAKRFHPEKVERIYFGLFRALGAGESAFSIDEVRWQPCLLPPGDERRRNGLAPLGFREAFFLGKKQIRGFNPGGPWTLFDPVAASHASRSFSALIGPVMAESGHMADIELPTGLRFRSPGRPSGLEGRKRTGPHVLTPGVVHNVLLQSDSRVAGVLHFWTDWPFQGSACAVLGTAEWDLHKPVFRKLTTALMRFACRGPFVATVTPEFIPVRDSDLCRVRGRVTVVNNGSGSGPVRVRCSRRDDTGTRSTAVSIEITPESTSTGWGDLGPVGRDTRPCVLTAAADGGAPAKTTIDPARTLEDLADWFVTRQRSDGRFSGVSFIDSRAARGLLAAFEIFHKPEYRKAALAWTEAMVTDQRSDGGYKMGYGDAKGMCYVADGGEIAMGVVRAVRYASPPMRNRLLRSVDAYLAFRESFRNEKGGIGIGWCLHDYIGNKRFEKLTREMRDRPFTLGCTLGIAGAAAALEPERTKGTANDVRRFLADRHTVAGVYAEGLMWVHRFTHDPILRRGIGERLIESLIAFTGDSSDRRPWWIQSGGRHAVTLAVLAYTYDNISKDSRFLAAMCRAEWALCALASPYALSHITQHADLEHDDWIYVCYSLVSLPELLRPGVSLPSLLPDQ